MPTGILVLAAGQSRRMGSDKRLLAWQNSSLLEHAIQLCSSSGLDYRLALSYRAEDDRIAQVYGRSCIRITESDLGLGHTLARAIELLPDSWSSVIVHLADMPLVKTPTLQKIARALQKHPIVIPSYQEKWGNPRGFARQLWPQLALLKGDQGAKDLIKKYSDLCHIVKVDDGGILVDIDTQEDYEAALLQATLKQA